jgi:DNA ligase-1
VIKAKLWSGQDLEGNWTVSLKLDGVRVLFTPNGPVSRNGKPLYNIPTDHNLKDCEVFLGDFKKTIQATRTKSPKEIPFSALYSIDPLDTRLLLAELSDPKSSEINDIFQDVTRSGHEGLVLRQGEVWLKVKTNETYDVLVNDVVEGIGKNTGKLGAFVTYYGNVGTGFTDQERIDFWFNPPIGQVVEVKCMSLTADNKFRHPSFVRMRPDK